MEVLAYGMSMMMKTDEEKKEEMHEIRSKV